MRCLYRRRDGDEAASTNHCRERSVLFFPATSKEESIHPCFYACSIAATCLPHPSFGARTSSPRAPLALSGPSNSITKALCRCLLVKAATHYSWPVGDDDGDVAAAAAGGAKGRSGRWSVMECRKRLSRLSSSLRLSAVSSTSLPSSTTRHTWRTVRLRRRSPAARTTTPRNHETHTPSDNPRTGHEPVSGCIPHAVMGVACAFMGDG